MTSIGLMILASGCLLMTVASIPEIGRRARGMFYGWFMAGSRCAGHGPGHCARLPGIAGI